MKRRAFGVGRLGGQISVEIGIEKNVGQLAAPVAAIVEKYHRVAIFNARARLRPARRKQQSRR